MIRHASLTRSQGNLKSPTQVHPSRLSQRRANRPIPGTENKSGQSGKARSVREIVRLGSHGLLRLGILAMGVAAVAIPGTAMAGPAGPGGPGGGGAVFGTLAGGSCGAKGSFTVDTASGTASVSNSKRTRCVPNSPSAVIAGFHKGDAVLARVSPGKEREAHDVLYDTSPFAIPGPDHNFRGTYAGSSSGQLSISQPRGGQVTVNVGPNTKYVENGARVSSPSYASGDTIAIHAREYTDSHRWATSVEIRAKRRTK
jgi:hypothetical protein